MQDTNHALWRSDLQDWLSLNGKLSKSVIDGQLISRLDQVQIKHIYRQANRCADALARMGAEQDISFLSLSCPPVDIRNSLDFDLSGLYSIRHGPELNLVL